MRSGSEVDKPTRLIDKPPAQPPVNQIWIDHFVDVVNQSAYLCVVRQTHIKDFSIYSERALPRLRSHRENHVKMFQDLAEPDVYVRVPAANADRAVETRHQPRDGNRKFPRLALGNAWRRG